MSSTIRHIAIFASGAGSNAQKIIEYFEGHESIKVSLVVSTKMTAGVLDIAKAHQIPTMVISKEQLNNKDFFLTALEQFNVEFIALAGFLWLIPSYLVAAYPNKMLNIHPSLLPKFGGKGMYGSRVHQAVIEAQETESGISIHYVNEHFDEGAVVFQAKCQVSVTDTPETLAQKIHQLEHESFPQVIEQVVYKNS